MADDGWEDVTDPHEVQRAQSQVLPKAPPKSKGASQGNGTVQDRVALAKMREKAAEAQNLERYGSNFLKRADRFHTGAGKGLVFDSMYPNGDGMMGYVKRPLGALLRGTVGQLYSNRDHEDYQYLQANAQGANNAALRLNKGTQTDGDAMRQSIESMGVGKSPKANRDIFRDLSRDTQAATRAETEAASAWIAAHGSLTGTQNAQGQTFDQWFNRVGRPRALQAARAPKSAPKGGWSISRD